MNLSPAQEDHERCAKEWAKSGKRLDMGKSRFRFKTLDDLALGVIGKAIARWTADQDIPNDEMG